MGTNIKVLHIISSAGIAGGERYLLDLIKYSNKSIEHFVVLPFPGPFEINLKKQNYNYCIINLRKKFAFNSLGEIKKLIREKNIDILHTHGYRANFYGRLACLFENIKHIVTTHVSLFDYLDTPFLLKYFYIFIEFIMSFKTSMFICISNAMAMDTRRIGIPQKKIVLIRNGVDLNLFYPRLINFKIRREIGINPNSFLIGTIGRMVPEKGQIFLVEALKYIKEEIKDIQCLFVGDGPNLPLIKKKASELNVKNLCIFAGLRRDVELIYPLFDVFVLPSYREPFGLVLLEALATGVPVIAINQGGPSEFITSGVNGILVSPNNPRFLASELINLFKNSKMANRLAEKGRKTVKNGFDIRNMVQKIDKIYFTLYGN